MTLAEATAQWLAATARDDSVSPECAESRALSLSWLVEYAGPRLALAGLTPARVRDFLGHWFIDHASISARRSRDASAMPEFTVVTTLTNTLAAFIDWAASVGLNSPDDCRAVIEELREHRNHVVALIGKQWWWKGTDELAHEEESAALFTFEGGLISRWQPFTDRAEALQAAGIES